MSENNSHPPGLGALLARLAGTGLDVLRNRGELISVEWREEKGRHAQLLLLGLGIVFMAFLGAALLTAVIIFLFHDTTARLWVALAFAVLYFAGAAWAAIRLKVLLTQAPFSETLNQLKQDRVWLDSLK
jgi:uncharacterized membrane protein YqjE